MLKTKYFFWLFYCKIITTLVTCILATHFLGYFVQMQLYKMLTDWLA